MNDLSTALEFLAAREWACLGRQGMAELLVEYALHASEKQRPFKVPFKKVKRIVPMPSDVVLNTKVIDGITTNVVTINTQSIWYEEMEEAVAEGERVAAIKILRNNTGIGLAESKMFLDKWYPEDDRSGVVSVTGTQGD
jgi:hypothetical protein